MTRDKQDDSRSNSQASGVLQSTASMISKPTLRLYLLREVTCPWLVNRRGNDCETLPEALGSRFR